MPKDSNPNAKPDDGTDDTAKVERFKALARELECDEDPAAFEAALGKLARSGPVAKHEPKKRQPKGTLT